MDNILTVVLPEYFTIENINTVLDEVIDNNLHPKNNEIFFDFRELRYISSSAINLLDNLIGWLEENRTEVYYVIPEIGEKGTKCPIRFLNQSGVLKKYDKNREAPEKDKKILQISDIWNNEITSFASYSFPAWIAGLLNESFSRVDTIKMCVVEVLNNVNNHSTAKKSNMFAHYVRDVDTYYISISDFGIGIPANVRKLHPDKNDEESLRWAIDEGNSTKTIPGNRGAGLAMLIDNAVLNGKGQVTLISNKGKLVCSLDEEGNKEYNCSNRVSHYPGTFVEIMIPGEHIIGMLDEEEEELDWDGL